jgi:uncharacterized membrane protein
MQRIEAGTSADVPVLEPGEADRWVPETVSGGPGSRVPWAGIGREGRRHALASVRPQPLAHRPDGVPDLSIETVMGTPARSAPVQVYVGLDSAPGPRERVDLAMAELERTGAFDRSLLVLVSPTGTGYVNYVAVIILVAASAVSLVVAERGTAVLLVVLTLLNAVIGLRQEGNAESAMNALKSTMKPTARVRRDGEGAEIPAEQLVVGDVCCPWPSATPVTG